MCVSSQIACNQMCGWKGIERLCGGGHDINGTSMVIENKYSVVRSVSLYCNSIGHVNDVSASLIRNEDASDETRASQAHTLYDNE